MDQEQRERSQEQGDDAENRTGGSAVNPPGQEGGLSAADVESSGTDGAGTGGVGADGGGYGPIPGSESTG